jgi:hypothetical protein
MTNTGPAGNGMPERRSRRRTTDASGHQRATSPGHTPVTAIAGATTKISCAPMARAYSIATRDLPLPAMSASIDAPRMSASCALTCAGSSGAAGTG